MGILETPKNIKFDLSKLSFGKNIIILDDDIFIMTKNKNSNKLHYNDNIIPNLNFINSLLERGRIIVNDIYDK